MTTRTRPPRLCSCGTIVPHGERCRCQIAATRERNARHDARRPTARERGYDHRWRAARLTFLKANPVCRMCGEPSTTVDHIIAHRGDTALFWTVDNWQALCSPCHNQVKQKFERSKATSSRSGNRSPIPRSWWKAMPSV